MFKYIQVSRIFKMWVCPTQLCPKPCAGVSFARMARMGFAATGPTLGSSASGGPSPGTSPGAWGPQLGMGPPSPAVAGAWGARSAAVTAPGSSKPAGVHPRAPLQ